MAPPASAPSLGQIMSEINEVKEHFRLKIAQQQLEISQLTGRVMVIETGLLYPLCKRQLCAEAADAINLLSGNKHPSPTFNDVGIPCHSLENS